MIDSWEKDQLIQKLLVLATHEVGVKEEGGNNCGPRIREYQMATWLIPSPWPWCAALACWLLREWLRNADVMMALNFSTQDMAEQWRCKDASAFGWEKWAKKRGLQVLPETELAKAGDFMVFDMSHIGLVIANQQGFETGKDLVYTIEGNTGSGGGRDGDGVWPKKRHYTMTRSYIRML